MSYCIKLYHSSTRTASNLDLEITLFVYLGIQNYKLFYEFIDSKIYLPWFLYKLLVTLCVQNATTFANISKLIWIFFFPFVLLYIHCRFLSGTKVFFCRNPAEYKKISWRKSHGLLNSGNLEFVLKLDVLKTP